MGQILLHIKLIALVFGAALAAPSFVQSSSVFPFEENPESFKDYMNNRHWGWGEIYFKTMRSCSKSSINSTETVYRCQESSWTEYEIDSNIEKSGRYDCLSGGAVWYKIVENKSTFNIERSNCSGSGLGHLSHTQITTGFTWIERRFGIMSLKLFFITSVIVVFTTMENVLAAAQEM